MKTDTRTVTVTLKIGGKVAQEPEGIRMIAAEIAALGSGRRFVLIHGGGVQVTELSRRLGLEPVFRDGVRLTSEREMDIVDMVLAGSVSTALVRTLSACGLKAVGLSGADGGLLSGKALGPESRTGTIAGVDSALIDVLLDAGYLPVLSSVASDSAGQGLNINADEMAFAVASRLRSDVLVFVSDVPGVLRGRTVLSSLTGEEAAKEIADGTISGGMLPKVKACLDAIDAGVGRVVISDYRKRGDLEDMLGGRKGTSIGGDGRDEARSPPSAQALARNPPLSKFFGTELLVLERGIGVRLEDAAGRRYLDFAGGIAVNALGYGRADLAEVAAAQMRKLVHVSNLYTTAPALELARTLAATGPFAAVQFQNSGSEANEAALKCARLYSYRTKGPGNHLILSFTGSFHGRTMGALACTPTSKYQEPFAPLMGGTAVSTYNDLQALRSTLDRRFAGVIVEVVQGEGGLDSMTVEFARELNRLCREHDVILIADEVQTGLSRTGTLFASQGVGLEPDIVTLAKPLAAGLPLAAALIPSRINDVMHAGEHGTTFGGGPVTCAVALEVWKTIGDPTFTRGVAARGEMLGRLLGERCGRIAGVGRVKGKGLLRGLEITATERRNAPEGSELMAGLVEAAREAGLLILRSGKNVLRIAPPLTISEAEIAEGVDLLGGVLGRELQQ